MGLLRDAVVFSVVGRIVVIGRDDGQSQILVERRQVIRQAGAAVKNAAK